MKMGIVISSSDAETIWNAFRLGVFALKQGDSVKAFLVAKGVEGEKFATVPFNVRELMQAFVTGGGSILTCGTCLKIRNTSATELCPLSTLNDLHELIRDCDKVVSF